jgi:crotonobetaine/carnitine-CoA ligase
MAGYDGLPEETVEAWRNFWFHTGDAARQDRAGNFHFVDRIKDCIRRRGENISSFEIESVIGAHEAVVEVATVAVKSEIRGGEDEIKAAVVCDRNVSPATLAEWCEARMPAFAVPRYIEVLTELPKTPTGKIQKHKLRELGVTERTWDRMQ